jgi:CO dehydrogenase maturation factor
MKILICGKGGCGKSTIAALLARELARRESKVLVVDSDESNIGLHKRLGMQKPEDFMNYFGGKKLLFEKTNQLTGKWKLDDLPEDYLSEKENIRLLSMGKIYEFGEGCACPINALSSKFLETLDLEDEEFMLADTDAGIEHFGRGVEKGVDMLLAVIDPSQESILLAKKISKLGEQVGKPVYYILNRIASQEVEEFLLDSIDKDRVIATIPENEDIFISGLAGIEFDVEVEGVRQIADMLESQKKAGGMVLRESN